MQNEIDQLRRQLLTLQVASCVLRNQLQGDPDEREKELQFKLLMESSVECGQLEESIDHLIKQRDNRG